MRRYYTIKAAAASAPRGYPALARVPELVVIDGSSPSEAAADIVLRYAESGQRPLSRQNY